MSKHKFEMFLPTDISDDDAIAIAVLAEVTPQMNRDGKDSYKSCTIDERVPTKIATISVIKGSFVL